MVFYADDLVIMTADPWKLRQALADLDEYCENNSLQVNGDKTKIVKFRRPHTAMVSSFADLFQYRSQNIEVVKEFIYLGVKLSQTLSPEAHMNHALFRAKNSDFALNSRVDLRETSYPSARKLCDAVVRNGVVSVTERPRHPF